ncbi:MAG: glutathione S-transferase family protein [Pseudomonadota bacterium]
MVMLAESDIRTPEVLSWKGLHLLHFMGSSCSQKTRIFLKLKDIPCELHHVDLAKHENYSDWFMGINPRGLVPVLIDDGQVIIESNDILLRLEQQFPDPALIPAESEEEARTLLEEEDQLHLDFRALSMRFVFSAKRAMRSEEQLKGYEDGGSGTVGGVRDANKARELEFFRDMLANDGITDEQVKAAVGRFRAAFENFEKQLESTAYLLSDELSILDIAWYIYSARLLAAGYPLHRLHPRVGAWYDALHARPEFSVEVAMPPIPPVPGPSLEEVAGI